MDEFLHRCSVVSSVHQLNYLRCDKRKSQDRYFGLKQTPILLHGVGITMPINLPFMMQYETQRSGVFSVLSTCLNVYSLSLLRHLRNIPYTLTVHPLKERVISGYVLSKVYFRTFTIIIRYHYLYMRYVRQRRRVIKE